MLTYLNSGIRDYYRNPLSTYRRGVWELQAVIGGAITPVFPDSPAENLQENTLWVFPPDNVHGWKGERDGEAEILVFHFSQIAKELEEICVNRKYLSIKLDDKDISFLRDEYTHLYKEYKEMGELYSLKSRIASDKLSLLVCTKSIHFLPSRRVNEATIVESAVALYSSEMESGINLNEISERIGLSIAHLRRLFHEVAGASPRSVFTEIKMKRAWELCCFTAYSFGEITRACGFAEQSSFSKAFYRYWNKTPTDVRAESHQSKKSV